MVQSSQIPTFRGAVVEFEKHAEHYSKKAYQYIGPLEALILHPRETGTAPASIPQYSTHPHIPYDSICIMPCF